jgi:hypothetical protein
VRAFRIAAGVVLAPVALIAGTLCIFFGAILALYWTLVPE